MFGKTCVNGGSHKYCARYDTRPNSQFLRTLADRGTSFEGSIPMEQIYICDVCTHCGHVISRPGLNQKEV